MCNVTAEMHILDRECEIFTRYLIGVAPSSYVRRKYLLAHEKLDYLSEPKRGEFDFYMLEMARRRPFMARLADSYATVFCRTSALRIKLVVLLAILESSEPFFRHFEMARPCWKAAAIFRMSYRGCGFLFCLVMATIVILPIKLFLPSRTAGSGIKENACG